MLNESSLSQTSTNFKVLVSLGGWGGCETCSDVFSSKEAREEFARSTAEIIEFYNADGIDLDWEYPGISGYPGHKWKPEDKENFTDLVVLLRKHMKEGDILSFAAGASSKFFENSVEWDKVMPLVDNVNLMTYDFYGSGSKQTGHHTALGSADFNGRSAYNSIEELIGYGVKPEQIFIGGAFYIKTFKNIDNKSNGLGQNAEWNRSYNQMNFEEVKENFSFYWDEIANSPYAYDSINKVFATFDDHKSIKLKSEYAIKNKLGGIMFWQLMNDKKKTSDSAKNTEECFEGTSRAIFKFNMALDDAILEPIAKGYNKLPSPIKSGASNFSSNSRSIPLSLGCNLSGTVS